MKVVVIIWDNFMFAEWDYLYLCMYLAMVTVGFMAKCQPIDKLANIRPTSSVMSTRSLLNMFVPFSIFAVSMAYLLYALTQAPNYVSINVVYYGIPTQLWPYRADNFLVPTVFLLSSWQMTNLAICYSYGFNHRKSFYKNPTLVFLVLASYGMLTWLAWAPPNIFSGIFRVNTDTTTSLKTGIPVISQLSVGAIGKCFQGPQMKFEREDAGDAFQYPHAEDDLGNRLPEESLCAQGGPNSTFGKQFTHRYPNSPTNCYGMNNCFTDDFKMMMTIVALAMSVATHAAYYFMNTRNPKTRTHFARL
jgi:hypothetical protein